MKILVLGVLLLPLNAVAAQSPVEMEAAALGSVMSFRPAWLGNDAPFDVCSAAEQLGGADALANIPAWIDRRFIRQTADSCPAIDWISVEDWSEVVHVKSIEVDDSTAVVRTYVVRRYYTHWEVFHLVRHGPPGSLWRVTEVRMKPALAI